MRALLAMADAEFRPVGIGILAAIAHRLEIDSAAISRYPSESPEKEADAGNLNANHFPVETAKESLSRAR